MFHDFEITHIVNDEIETYKLKTDCFATAEASANIRYMDWLSIENVDTGEVVHRTITMFSGEKISRETMWLLEKRAACV